jgi:hypothetical protein
MARRLVLFFIICMSFILLDVFARFLFYNDWFSFIKLSKEVDAFNIISLLVSSFVTICVGWYLVKMLTEQRYEKEFLIKDLITLEIELDDLSHLIKNGTIDLNDIIIIINRIQKLQSKFVLTLKIVGRHKAVDEKLNIYFNNLYRILTDCDNNQLNFIKDNKTGIEEVENIIYNYTCLLRKQIFKVNKH